jgi:hypothetical protein
MIPLEQSTGEPDPWADVSGPTPGQPDGTVNMRDIAYEVLHFNDNVSNMTRDVNVTNWPTTQSVVISDNSSRGHFNFSLAANDNANFTISTDGFESVTVTINAVAANTVYGWYSFEIFVGLYHYGGVGNYGVQTGTAKGVILAKIYYPWYTNPYVKPSFIETYAVTAPILFITIWNNSTQTGLYGNLDYYCTT